MAVIALFLSLFLSLSFSFILCLYFHSLSYSLLSLALSLSFYFSLSLSFFSLHLSFYFSLVLSSIELNGQCENYCPVSRTALWLIVANWRYIWAHCWIERLLCPNVPWIWDLGGVTWKVCVHVCVCAHAHVCVCIRGGRGCGYQSVKCRCFHHCLFTKQTKKNLPPISPSLIPTPPRYCAWGELLELHLSLQFFSSSFMS